MSGAEIQAAHTEVGLSAGHECRDAFIRSIIDSANSGELDNPENFFEVSLKARSKIVQTAKEYGDDLFDLVGQVVDDDEMRQKLQEREWKCLPEELRIEFVEFDETGKVMGITTKAEKNAYKVMFPELIQPEDDLLGSKSGGFFGDAGAALIGVAATWSKFKDAKPGWYDRLLKHKGLRALTGGMVGLSLLTSGCDQATEVAPPIETARATEVVTEPVNIPEPTATEAASTPTPTVEPPVGAQANPTEAAANAEPAVWKQPSLAEMAVNTSPVELPEYAKWYIENVRSDLEEMGIEVEKVEYYQNSDGTNWTLLAYTNDGQAVWAKFADTGELHAFPLVFDVDKTDDAYHVVDQAGGRPLEYVTIPGESISATWPGDHEPPVLVDSPVDVNGKFYSRYLNKNREWVIHPDLGIPADQGVVELAQLEDNLVGLNQDGEQVVTWDGKKWIIPTPESWNDPKIMAEVEKVIAENADKQEAWLEKMRGSEHLVGGAFSTLQRYGVEMASANLMSSTFISAEEIEVEGTKLLIGFFGRYDAEQDKMSDPIPGLLGGVSRNGKFGQLPVHNSDAFIKFSGYEEMKVFYEQVSPFTDLQSFTVGITFDKNDQPELGVYANHIRQDYDNLWEPSRYPDNSFMEQTYLRYGHDYVSTIPNADGANNDENLRIFLTYFNDQENLKVLSEATPFGLIIAHLDFRK